MKIGIIQASSQSDKNELICDSVHKYAGDSEIVNFGCFRDDKYFALLSVNPIYKKGTPVYFLYFPKDANIGGAVVRYEELFYG